MLKDLPPTMLRNRTPFQTPLVFQFGCLSLPKLVIFFHVREEIDISDRGFSKIWLQLGGSSQWQLVTRIYIPGLVIR